MYKILQKLIPPLIGTDGRVVNSTSTYIMKTIFLKNTIVQCNIAAGEEKAPARKWAMNKGKPETLAQRWFKTVSTHVKLKVFLSLRAKSGAMKY